MSGGLIERIGGDPAGLKSLDPAQFEELASEIRQKLISTVAETGGHLAPSLGVVELTLALLAEMDLPRDEIVWDVGHQCYPFKLLTGRADRFHTLRKKGGISGFPKRDESPYDCFDTGHSSTSISAALGKAKARDLKGEDRNIAAVIGDGALTGGLALEGLNHAGRTTRKLLVVLNDNTMSIDQNVGAFSRYLNKIRTQPFYRDNRDYARDLIRQIPRVGGRLYRILARVEGSLKYLVVPGMLFEELGFMYLGPVDGHDIPLLRETFAEALQQNSKPVLVHVKTEKGRGYGPAEKDKPKFHGTGPFDAKNGEQKKKKGPATYTSVFGRSICELARENGKITAITAAMAHGTGLVAFSREFPDRYFDVGIAEQHAVVLAAGMASAGYRPVVALYSTFLQRAYDQVVHDVCLQNLPVTFAIDRGGLVGEDGPTHHGVFDLSYLRHVPNMVLMSPRDENELRRMLLTCIGHDGPTAVRYPRGEGEGVSLDEKITPLTIGEAQLLEEGEKVAVLALGPMVSLALEAAESLRRRGKGPTVVNMRFVKPLDGKMLVDLAGRGFSFVTVEENVTAGGMGSAVLELLQKNGFAGTRVEMLGVPDAFVAHGAVGELRKECGLSVAGICDAVERIMDR